ncbi:MAG: hypothetical protein HC916_19810 [Coleofasciculaceae cyanobacterium SM2_1_6]|nr:hypothetical protein [Coleofasciculaceae cyanobacterium SM2_1_6]
MTNPDDAPLVGEIIRSVLNDSRTTFIDIAEIFSWIDRKLWGMVREFLPDRDMEKLFSLVTMTG